MARNSKNTFKSCRLRNKGGRTAPGASRNLGPQLLNKNTCKMHDLLLPPGPFRAACPVLWLLGHFGSPAMFCGSSVGALLGGCGPGPQNLCIFTVGALPGRRKYAYLRWVRSGGRLGQIFGEAGQADFVAIYGGCALGGSLGRSFASLCKQILLLFAVGALWGASWADLW